MKYGIVTNHPVKIHVGAVYILEDLDEDYYIVKEGNCDAIRKDAITLISKKEYDIIRIVQNEIFKNIDNFTDETKEYIELLYKLRNEV